MRLSHRRPITSQASHIAGLSHRRPITSQAYHIAARCQQLCSLLSTSKPREDFNQGLSQGLMNKAVAGVVLKITGQDEKDVKDEKESGAADTAATIVGVRTNPAAPDYFENQSRKRPRLLNSAHTSTDVLVSGLLESLVKARGSGKDIKSIREILRDDTTRKSILSLAVVPSSSTTHEKDGEARDSEELMSTKQDDRLKEEYVSKLQKRNRLLKKLVASSPVATIAPDCKATSPVSMYRLSLIQKVADRLSGNKTASRNPPTAPSAETAVDIVEGGDVGAAGNNNNHNSPLEQELLEHIGSMPPEEKAAYLEACTVAPQVVKEESKVDWFLRVARNDTRTAARRLVHYWAERKDKFGERAFLPLLDLSGKGALSCDDLKLMDSDTITPLPVDGKGRMVFLSRSKAPDEDVEKARIGVFRLLFYWGLALSSNPSAQAPGVCVLHHVTSSKLNGHFLAQTFRLFEYDIPVRFDAYHFFCIPRAADRQHYKKIVAPLALQATGGLLTNRVEFILGKSPADLMSKLEKLGYSKSGVPESVGGTWSKE